MMDQIERIKYFENILNEGSEAIDNLYKAIDKLIALKEKIVILDKYYQGDLIKEDIKSDIEGLLPKDLLTGVLAEDYAYDLLTSYDELYEKVKNI